MRLLDRLKSAVLRPTTGQSTGAQVPQTGPRALGGIASIDGTVTGFRPPDPGTYDLYRRIGRHPTVALIKAIATAPVRTNVMGWQSREDADPTWLPFVKAVVDPLYRCLVRELLRALEFGWFPGEVVWQPCRTVTHTKRGADGTSSQSTRVTFGDGEQLGIQRVKPLLVDNTDPLVDGNGNVRGLRNRSQNKQPVELVGPRCLIYTYDGEAGNPYGCSRHENIRKAFGQADEVLERLGSYTKKVASIILQLHYPDGTSKDEMGADRPNFEIAKRLLVEVANGRSVALVNKFSSMLSGEGGFATPSAMEKALMAAGKSDWVFSFLDAGGTDFAPGLLTTLEYYDKLLCRGWLRPERSAIEAVKGGSRADSQSHTDTGMTDSELVAWDIANVIREQLVDPLLVVNFGEDARGAVWPEPSPMNDTTGQTFTAIIEAMLANPQLAEPLGRKIDVDAMLDDQEIPVVEAERGPIGDTILPMVPALAGQGTGGSDEQQQGAEQQ